MEYKVFNLNNSEIEFIDTVNHFEALILNYITKKENYRQSHLPSWYYDKILEGEKSASMDEYATLKKRKAIT